MKIDCIADLHGERPELPGGDLLIVAGDLTGANNQIEIDRFGQWISQQEYNKKIFITGNHDNLLVEEKPRKYFVNINGNSYERCEYLCDSCTEFKGLKIWGSPWTKTFVGMNPHCKAFTCESDKELAEKWALIPEDTEILVTHSPPFSILDKNAQGFNVGSITLWERLRKLPKLKLHVFGHIHREGGQMLSRTWVFAKRETPIMFVNCAHMDEVYDPVNGFVSVDLP